jgi:threonyl-tRNA synthetase
MLIVGEKESEQNEVSVRQRGVGDLGSVTFEKFIEMINIAVNRELSTEI